MGVTNICEQEATLGFIHTRALMCHRQAAYIFNIWSKFRKQMTRVWDTTEHFRKSLVHLNRLPFMYMHSRGWQCWHHICNDAHLENWLQGSVDCRVVTHTLWQETRVNRANGLYTTTEVSQKRFVRWVSGVLSENKISCQPASDTVPSWATVLPFSKDHLLHNPRTVPNFIHNIARNHSFINPQKFCFQSCKLAE